MTIHVFCQCILIVFMIAGFFISLKEKMEGIEAKPPVTFGGMVSFFITYLIVVLLWAGVGIFSF